MGEQSHGRSLPWFRVDVDLVDHPKVLALADAWGVSEAEAGWAIIRLWAWTMRYAARGRLAPGARPALERACNVHPTRGDVLGGLVAAGWVDDLGADGWEVHDWGLHNGAAVVKAEKDAERKRAARARRSNGHGQSADGRADGAGNGTGRDGTYKEGPIAVASAPPLQLEALPSKATRTRQPPDPEAEYQRFRAALTPDEAAVYGAYADAFGLDLGPDWALRKFLGQRLKTHTREELVAAVRGAAKDPWHRDKGSTLRAILRDASAIAQHAKRGAA